MSSATAVDLRGHAVPTSRSGRAGSVLLAGGDVGLGLGGVDVDVLLTRQAHQLVHDLVGDRAEHEPVVLHAGVAREVHRLADPDTDAADVRHDLTGRLDL